MPGFQSYLNALSPDCGAVIRSPDERIDKALQQRITRAYRLATQHSDDDDTSIWTTIIHQLREPIHVALLGDDDDLIASLLSNPAQNDLYYGMDSISKYSTECLVNTDPSRSYLMRFILDTLVMFAEATGVYPTWNPEGGLGRLIAPDVESFLSKLEAILGIKIVFPNPFNLEFGIKTSRGVMGQRGPLALYQAWRTAELCRAFRDKRILEIGAGVGRAAYYANLMGMADYTIVDLPLSIVGQAVFLGSVLGPDAIWMPGDPVSEQRGRIRLMPPQWIDDTLEQFDLIVNVDSLTELSNEQAIKYFRFALEHARLLFSINHEANSFRVHDLPHLAGVPHLKRTRHACPVRPGYVEECFYSPTPKRFRLPWQRRKTLFADVGGNGAVRTG